MEVVEATPSSAGAAPASHPIGLYVLFFTELWERLSYYGVRALLILYLTGPLRYDDVTAFLTYGAYTSIIYFTGLAGGAVADRIIGAQRAIILGGVLIIIGHIGLVLSVLLGETGGGTANVLAHGHTSDNLFLSSLALIAIGIGFLKPNSTALVGSLYERTDVRRESGFTLFYVGINIGAMLGPVTCGFIGEMYGWEYGFGAAGAGMVLGLAVFLANRHKVTPLENERRGQAGSVLTMRQRYGMLVGIVCVAGCIWFMLTRQAVVGYVLAVAVAGVAVYFIRYLAVQCSGSERGMLSVALIHVLFSIIFWMLLEQGGGSLNLFNARFVDRTVLGFVVPASVFMSLEPVFVLLLGPLFSIAWMFLGRRGLQIFVATKFGLGLVLMGVSFFIVAYVARHAPDSGGISIAFIVLVNCLFATAECFLAPAGLSIVTGWSPQRIAGFMAGIWFLGMASGGFLAGLAASGMSAGAAAGEHVGIDSYANLYVQLGAIGLVSGAAIFLLTPLLKRLAFR